MSQPFETNRTPYNSHPKWRSHYPSNNRPLGLPIRNLSQVRMWFESESLDVSREDELTFFVSSHAFYAHVHMWICLTDSQGKDMYHSMPQGKRTCTIPCFLCTCPHVHAFECAWLIHRGKTCTPKRTWNSINFYFRLHVSIIDCWTKKLKLFPLCDWSLTRTCRKPQP